MTNASGFLETNGARIYYEADGDGPAVILIHAGVANLRMWDDQVTALRERYRVIRYDTRGFGQTVTDAGEYSNRADIAALLDHVGEDSAHVLGISRGGKIALDFALEYPYRTRSVVVAAGGIGGYESPDEANASEFEAAEKMVEAKDWAGISEWETDYWAEGPGQPRGRVHPAVRAKVHDWILTTYQAEKEEGQPQPLDPPAVGRLGELKAPLLVMIGTLDDSGTQESMHHLAAAVPGARLEVFEGSAHMINLEQPDRFNRVLTAFLDAPAESP
ncbi:MAG: alpha/beta fold hydrolase [Candidatus Limnocylindria bacterium]